MLPSSLKTSYVKVIFGGKNYYSSKLATTLDAGNNGDVISADFTNEGVIIAKDNTIEIHISGITNPPTVTPLNEFFIEILGRYDLSATTTYRQRE